MDVGTPNTDDRELAEIRSEIRRLRELFEIIPLLLSHVTDVTHVSVPRAAELLGVSQKTIRRRIAAGLLSLDVVPGTRKSGVPLDQLYAGWISLARCKAALQRERGEVMGDEQDRT